MGSGKRARRRLVRTKVTFQTRRDIANGSEQMIGTGRIFVITRTVGDNATSWAGATITQCRVPELSDMQGTMGTCTRIKTKWYDGGWRNASLVDDEYARHDGHNKVTDSKSQHKTDFANYSKFYSNDCCCRDVVVSSEGA